MLFYPAMKKIYGIICIGSCLLMSSCASDGIMEDTDQVGSEGFTVQLNLNTRSSFTRSEGHGRDDGSEAENFINIINKDYQIYIVDGEDDARIISKFEPSSVVRKDDGTYRLLGTFYNEEGLKKIRFMALANWKTAFTQGNYPEVPTEGDFYLDDLYTNKTNYNFVYPVDESSVGETWMPKNETSGIPMVGLSVSQSIPEAGTSVPGQFPWIEVSSINMLRALAKITVTDKTNDDDVELVSVNIKNYNSDGRFIQDGSKNENKDWNEEATQVTVPTLTEEPVKGMELYFNRSEDGKSFVAYVPEVDNNSPNEEDKCYLEVTAKLKGLEKNYQIHLGDYDNGTYVPGSFMDLLRNHWYNFDIRSVSANGIILTVTVVDKWDVIHEMELE